MLVGWLGADGTAIAWSTVNQVVISLANIALAVVLARGLGRSEYGQVVVAMAVLYFMATVQGALLTQPHNILGQSFAGLTYRVYTTSTAIGQLILVGGVASTLLLIQATAKAIGIAEYVSSFAVATGAAICTFQMLEFCRRVLYTEHRERTATLLDLLAYASMLILLGMALRLEQLSPVTVMWVLSTGFAVGSMGGVTAIRKSLTLEIGASDVKWANRLNWKTGRWLFGSVIAFWFSAQMFPLVAAAILGASAAAAMRVCQTLMGPATLLIRGFESSMLPRASAAYQRFGTGSAVALVRRWGLRVASLAVAYCLILSLMAEHVLARVFGPEYSEYSWLVVCYAIAQITLAPTVAASVVLRSIDRPRALFTAQAVAAVLSLTLGACFIYAFGLPGVGWGLILESLALSVVMIWIARQTLLDKHEV